MAASEITAETLDKALSALTELSMKPPTHYTIRTAIEQLLPQRKALQDKGFSTESITQALRESGIDLKTNTLRLYLADISKSDKVAQTLKQTPALSDTPKRRGRKPKSAQTAITPAPKTAVAQSVDIAQNSKSHAFIEDA